MRRLRALILALALPLVAGCTPVALDRGAPAAHARRAPGDGALAPLLEGVGTWSHPVATRSARAQRFFDQGLRLTYAFNHAEAIRAFDEAARLDPTCAMAFWGKALALGPNINDAMPAEREERALAAIRRAQGLAAAGASESERAYVDALARRYGEPAGEQRAERDAAYADAMADLARTHPEDADALTLSAAALMERTPWDYWEDPATPRPVTEQARAALEAAIALAPDHAGAHHYYIHLLEASAAPERAEASADRLATLTTSAGHLVHMPAHIYARVGRYGDAIDANVRAVAADEDYLTQCRAQGLYPVGYYPHNLHFLWYAATEAGASAVALDAARTTGTKAPPQELCHYPMLRDFLVTPMLASARFGRWDDVLALPAPDDAFARGIWHHVRSLALAAAGRVAEAEREVARMRALVGAPGAAETMVVWGAVPSSTLLRLAAHVSAGRIAARRGDHARAIRELEAAVRIEDALPYNEPPAWHQPPRHVLGALQLGAGRAADAERTYRQDLERHRENGWALFGLLQSLRAQGKDASDVEERFRRAWARADVTLSASHF